MNKKLLSLLLAGLAVPLTPVVSAPKQDGKTEQSDSDKEKPGKPDRPDKRDKPAKRDQEEAQAQRVREISEQAAALAARLREIQAASEKLQKELHAAREHAPAPADGSARREQEEKIAQIKAASEARVRELETRLEKSRQEFHAELEKSRAEATARIRELETQLAKVTAENKTRTEKEKAAGSSRNSAEESAMKLLVQSKEFEKKLSEHRAALELTNLKLEQRTQEKLELEARLGAIQKNTAPSTAPQANDKPPGKKSSPIKATATAELKAEPVVKDKPGSKPEPKPEGKAAATPPSDFPAISCVQDDAGIERDFARTARQAAEILKANPKARFQIISHAGLDVDVTEALRQSGLRAAYLAAYLK